MDTQAFDAQRQSFPDEPWKWRQEWTDPRGILETKNTGCLTAGLFVVGWLLLMLAGLGAVTTAFSYFDESKRQPVDWTPVVVFGGLAAAALWLSKRKPTPAAEKKLARFVPLELPLPLGGDVVGMILVPRPLTVTGPARISLSCVQRELREERDDGHRKTRERRETIGDVRERVIPAAEWKREGTGTQAVVLIPARGRHGTTPTLLAPDHPVFEWHLRAEIPATEGKVSVVFNLPVFPVGGANAAVADAPNSQAEEPAAPTSVAEAVTQALETPAAAAPVEADQAEVFSAANITRQPRSGAVGSEALVMDPESAAAATKLLWLGYPVAILFIALFAMMLFAIPLLGPLLAIALVGYSGYSMFGAMRKMWIRRQGAETLWVEGNAICCADDAGRIERIPRLEIQRIEVVPVGSVGARQYFTLIAAGAPGPTGPQRTRRTIAESVCSREAAHAVAYWLSNLLNAPHPPVVNAERGMEYTEKLAGWLNRRRGQNR